MDTNEIAAITFSKSEITHSHKWFLWMFAAQRHSAFAVSRCLFWDFLDDLMFSLHMKEPGKANRIIVKLIFFWV